jgi:hypothetical protein
LQGVISLLTLVNLSARLGECRLDQTLTTTGNARWRFFRVATAGDKVPIRYYGDADYDIPISATDLK